MSVLAPSGWKRWLDIYVMVLCALLVLACILYWTMRLRWPWYIAGIASMPFGVLRLISALTFVAMATYHGSRIAWRLLTGRPVLPDPPRTPAPPTKTQIRKLRRAQGALR